MMLYWCVLLLAFTSISAEQEDEKQEVRTRCHCAARIRNGSIEGEISFVQYQHIGDFTIKVKVEGVTPGLHAIHVATKGDLGDGCYNAGPHYNPENKLHGCPAADGNNRHKGDFGNFDFPSSGLVHIIKTIPDSETKITEFLGRAAVIHADVDDCGKGNFPDSKTIGHSGKRIACGYITDYQCEEIDIPLNDD